MIASPALAGVDAALANAMLLLERDPELAAEQARQVLMVMPGQPEARLIISMAHNALGRHSEALAQLEPLAIEQPDAPRVQLELALALAGVHRPARAIEVLAQAIRLQPDFPSVWLHMGDLLREVGDPQRADAAYLNHVGTARNDPQLLAAGEALAAGRLPEAEKILRARLRALPNDVAAMRMLAELGARVGRNQQALALLERCLQLAPGFAMARHNYAVVLDRLSRYQDALVEVESLLAQDPGHVSLLKLKAGVVGKLGDHGEAIRLYESILRTRPNDSRVWMSLGHALKTEGRTDRAIAAYRRAIELKPAFGNAWWSLANLKTVRFDGRDIAAMQAQLNDGDLDEEPRLHFEFALGKALEDAGKYEASFRHYARGNVLRRGQLPYSADQNAECRKIAQAVYTEGFFAERAGVGCQDQAPVFILGMPRAGSTLVEQILCSHPDVEATMELPDIGAITRALRLRMQLPDAAPYHDIVAMLPADELRALGEDYIRRTLVQRKLGRRLFIDKMPNNFAHVGLIHLILPNARIIDVRRHPLACCFSNFKQHFARGQAFSYDLADMGRYYRDYVGLMAHFDQVLPGRVHRMIYEDLVIDTEAQVRTMLAYCGLEFDEQCLRFFENERPVRTASSEQVRRPIYRDGLDQWRRYDAWLDPLKLALGPVLDSYPAAPHDPP